MKKLLFILALLLTTLITISCNNVVKADIVVSSYPIYDLTKRITQDKLSVINLNQENIDVHDFDLTPRDAAMLYETKLFIINGLNLEPYISNLTDDLKNKTFACTSNIDLIYSNYTNNDDVDPHVWLNPNNAIIMMENIKNKIIEIDSVNKAYYEKNFNTNKELLLKLDNLYKTNLTNLKSNYLITSHEAFGYLCNAYNLTQISIGGLSTSDEVTARDIENILNQINDLNATTVFYEENESNVLAKTIAAEANLSYESLNPLEFSPNSGDYISVMEENLAKILKALK